MITLIFHGDIKYCPYAKRYIERLKKRHIEYCVLFWNRSGDVLDLGKEYICFEKKSDIAKNVFFKVCC